MNARQIYFPLLIFLTSLGNALNAQIIENASVSGLSVQNSRADNTAALQKAFGKHVAGNLDILLIDSGTYLFDGQIEIGGWDGLQIIGDENTVLSTNADKPIFMETNDNSIVKNGLLKNITLENTFDGVTNYGINPALFFIGNTFFENFTFDEVEFRAPNANVNGIYISNSSSPYVTSGLVVKNCRFHHLGRMGVELNNHPVHPDGKINFDDPTLRYFDISFENNFFEHLGLVTDVRGETHGMGISLSGKGDDGVITNNFFGENIQNINIENTGMDNIEIIGNIHLGSPGSMYQFSNEWSVSNVLISNDRALGQYDSNVFTNVNNVEIRDTKMKTDQSLTNVENFTVINSIISKTNLALPITDPRAYYGVISLGGTIRNIFFDKCVLGELNTIYPVFFAKSNIVNTDNNINVTNSCVYKIQENTAGYSISLNNINVTENCTNFFDPDTENPVAPLLNAINIDDTSVKFNWTPSVDNEGVAKYVLYRDGAHGITFSPLTTSTMIRGLVAGISYKFMLRAYDASGNFVNSNVLTITPGNHIDEQFPTIPILAADNVTTNSVNLYWTPAIDDIGVSKYELFRDGAHGIELSSQINSYTATNLIEGREYTFMVRVSDAVQNETNSNDFKVTPGNTLDEIAPSAPILGASEVESFNISLNWSFSHDNIGIHSYRLKVDDEIVADFPPTASSYDVLGLTAGVSYNFVIEAIDPAGNTTSSNALNLTPGGTVDNQAPSPPQLGLAGTGTGLVQLYWTPASDNVGISRYELYTNGAHKVVLPVNASTYTINDLSNGTFYAFMVRAVDAAGNETNSNELEMTFGEIVDNQAPSPPVLSASGIMDNTIQLSWTHASDNYGISKYTLFRNGGHPINLGPGVTIFSVSSLTPGNTYNFLVRAFDAAGNRVDSNELLVTTTNQGTSLKAVFPSFETNQTLDQSIVYPNPVHDKLNVQLPNDFGGLIHYYIFDSNGKRVIQNIIEPNNGNQFDISVSSLPDGIYFLKILDNEKAELFDFKIIVEK